MGLVGNTVWDHVCALQLSSVGAAPTDDAGAAAMQAQLVESMRREQEQAALAAAYKQQVQQLVRDKDGKDCLVYGCKPRVEGFRVALR